MPELRGRRHSWERDGEWATCTNCGLKVETRMIRRGGLPTCDEVIARERKSKQKLRGRRHSWERDGEWATCTNCGLKVETRMIRRGGLPTCDEVMDSSPQEIAIPEKSKSYFQEYRDSYRKGYERYGVWWKLFTLSMISFAAVFIAVAIFLFVIFLL